MQTSSLTPITLYCSQREDIACLLPLLPTDSIAVDNLENIPDHRRAILVTHEQSSARKASQWISKQMAYRHSQLMLILPTGESRLSPLCMHQHRPLHFNIIHQFLNASRALPDIPPSLKLTEIETSLIEQLHIADESVTHDILMQNIWGHKTELDTHTLETHLYRLRKKLEKTDIFITTNEGSYQLVLSSNK